MDFTQLEYLVEAARLGSFAKAAEAKFTSRQNVSQSIRALEGELGGTLFFKRVGNRMQLTGAGEDALRYANRMLSTREEMLRTFTHRDDKRAVLHILLAVNLLAYATSNVAEVIYSYEESRLVIAERGAERCYFRVRSNKADGAVVLCMPRSFDGCIVRDLGSYPFHALVRKGAPLASRQALDVSDLVGYRLLLMSNPDFQYAQLIRKLDDVGYDRDDIVQLLSVPTMKDAMQRLDAVALVNPEFLEGDLSSDYAAVPFSDPSMRWHIYAIRSESAKMASEVDRLFDAMEQRLGS